MKKLLQIAIIDDQLLFVESLKELLITFPFIEKVDILPCPTSTTYKVPFLEYDILFVDINMPFINGFEFSAQIKAQMPSQTICLLSVRYDRISIAKAKEIGIEGYISKNINKNDLIIAISILSNKESYYQNREKQNEKYFSFNDGTKIILTNREIEFLELLLQQLTTKEIAQKMFISEHTVIGYRKILFEKFNVNNMIGLAKYAMEILQ